MNRWAEMNEGRKTLGEGYRGEGSVPAYADPEHRYFGSTLTKNPAWRPTVNDPIPTGICEYTSQDGRRCTRKAVPGTGNDPTDRFMCTYHGGRLPNVAAKAERVKAAALDSLLDYVKDSVDHLGKTVTDTSVPDAVRLKAATEILDRTGVKQADRLDVTVENKRSAGEIMAEKIRALRESQMEQIVDEDTDDA